VSGRGVRVLLTGGAGYIGSVLTRRLLDAGYRVTVVDNFLYRQNSLVDCCGRENFEVVPGDCRDPRIMKDLIRDVDVLIPLAALVGAPVCDRYPADAKSVNVDAVRWLCRTASRSQRILYPNSNSGYGIGRKDKFCTEDSPLRPVSLYGRTKVEAEKIVLDRGNAVTFRFATVFGVSPRMRTDLLVNNFVYRAVRDGSLLLFEGGFRRNFLHIQDAARVFLHAIDRFQAMRNKPYNVGLEDANLSKIELCRRIQGVIPGFTFQEAPVGRDPDQRDYVVSNARILSTGFRTQKTLEDGIRELAKCYRVLQDSGQANV
jgi:nucleoside-diphosphate-sugar epimerase